MELLYADEYIACIQAGKKPRIAIAGPFWVKGGYLSQSGKHLLDIDGILYEVKPNFPLYVQWEDEYGSSLEKS